jgi:hypothetical protein
MSGDLLRAAATAFFAIVVFVIGQMVQRLVIEPIQDQRRTIGEITFALLMYDNVSHVAKRNADGHTVVDIDEPVTVIKTLRGLGAKLQQSLRVIPMYSVFERLRMVVPRSRIDTATKGLTGWSNSIYSGDPEPHKSAIIRSLRIRTNDAGPVVLPTKTTPPAL